MRVAQGIAFLGLVAISVAVAHATNRPSSPQFKTSSELCTFAIAHGLVMTQEKGNRQVFYVSDHTLTKDDIVAVAIQRDRGLTPQWRGILWASQVRGRILGLYADSVHGNKRMWGNVLVAGDEQLMDRIEAMHRSN
jgi:hypothetical protein